MRVDHIVRVMRGKADTLRRRSGSAHPVIPWRKADTPGRLGATLARNWSRFLRPWRLWHRRHKRDLPAGCQGGCPPGLSAAPPLTDKDTPSDPRAALSNRWHQAG
jgi:hypothetical protein